MKFLSARGTAVKVLRPHAQTIANLCEPVFSVVSWDYHEDENQSDDDDNDRLGFEFQNLQLLK